MAQLFTNNASSTLAANVTVGATSIQVNTGDGALFPNPSGVDYFLVTMFKVTSGVETAWEIVKCTARSGDVLTVTRAQEGTTAQAFNSGDRVQLRFTAASANALSAIGATPVTIASASTVAVGAATSDNVIISGTTTITAFDTVNSGIRRFVTFSGALTLTYNATSMILPGAANITTAANDTALFESLGSGNWQCVSYTRASSLPVIPSLPTNFTNQQYFGTQTLTDGATINWAANTQQVAKVTLGGNRTMAAPTGLVDGAFYNLAVYQDATGSRTLTWNSVFKFTAGTAPTLSTAANAKDFFTFKSDGTNLYEQGRSQAVA